MITLTQQQQVIYYARQAFPKECCGIIGHDDVVVPCENVHHDPDFNFLINPTMFNRVANEHGIAAIYHSHCTFNGHPGQGDLQGCEHFDIPYLVVSVWPEHGIRAVLNAKLWAFVLCLEDEKQRKYFRGAPEVLECM
jgi:proteasome lid subunit RPN8/RPN11